MALSPAPLDKETAFTLHNLHKSAGSLSYSTGAITFVAALVTLTALAVLASCAIHAAYTGTPLYLKASLPSLIALVLMVPLGVLAVRLQRSLTQKRAVLLNAMTVQLAPLEHFSTKLLTPFIEENILKDLHDSKIRWHRTYKEHILSQLEAECPKGEFPHLNEALAKAKKNLTKELERLAEQD